MIRKPLKENLIGMNKEFRYRGEEQTRIETFSDAVFALAITMLVISTEVPKDFSEMLVFLADIIPFALCMTLIVYIWYEHFQFFIRYGFRNARIVVLNSILLFFILFYVFPLKFLARLLVTIYGNIFMNMIGFEKHALVSTTNMISGSEMPDLMIIYGLGAAFIFLILGLMYRYALGKKDELELNDIEVFDTRSSLYIQIIMGAIPLLSVLISLLFHSYRFSSMFSGFCYMLYPVVFVFYGKRRAKKRKLVLGTSKK